METLESSRVCRLCGKHSGISINIFDKNESHVRKINAVLPIMVHEMDLLPKHMCHRCSYKLEEFHKFYVDCLKTDADLKSQLSWMRKEDSKERVGVPMVHIENVKIKQEPPEYDVYELEPIVENVNYINSMSSMTFPVNAVQTNSLDGLTTYTTYTRCRCYRDKEQDNDKINMPLARKDHPVPVLNNQREATLKNFEMATAEISVARGSNSRTLVDDHQLRAARRNLLDDFDGRADNSRTARADYGLRGDAMETNVRNVADEPVNAVRNLRPRKVSVSYVNKKRCHPAARTKNAVAKVARTELRVVPRIKVEKVDDAEGRSLRPRNTTINYYHGRKRTPKIVDAARQDDVYGTKRFKVAGSGQQEEKAADCQASRIPIKQEPSYENTLESGSRTLELPQTCDGRIRSLAKKLSNVQSKKSGSSAYEKTSGSRTEGILGALKTFGRVEKKRTPRTGIRRIDSGCHSPKFLRSHDLHLRNGKVMFDGVARRSARRLRRDFKAMGRPVAKKQVENGGNTLLNVVKRATGAKRIAAMKMIDNYIKHYCEKCSVSFPNKELFKLHACYV